MDTRIQFRINEETKRLAQISAERKGITLSDACRDLIENLAIEQKEIENHNEWLKFEVNEAYERFNRHESELFSNETAKQMLALRRKQNKNQK